MENNFKIIGVTGGVGAGKSTILKYLEYSYNCNVFVTDMIAYDIMRNDNKCLSEIMGIFKDDDILDERGSLDSSKIGKVIFSCDDKRRAMNSIVHPRVIKAVIDGCAKIKQDHLADFAVVESALLIECGLSAKCDEVWYITAPAKIRIQRLKTSRHYSSQKCNSIIKGQLSEEEFRKHATAVIDTGVRHNVTYEQIDQVLGAYGYSKKSFSYEGDDIIGTIMESMS